MIRALLRLIFPPVGAHCAMCDRFTPVAMVGTGMWDAWCKECAKLALAEMLDRPEDKKRVVPFRRGA